MTSLNVLYIDKNWSRIPCIAAHQHNNNSEYKTSVFQFMYKLVALCPDMSVWYSIVKAYTCTNAHTHLMQVNKIRNKKKMEKLHPATNCRTAKKWKRKKPCGIVANSVLSQQRHPQSIRDINMDQI